MDKNSRHRPAASIPSMLTQQVHYSEFRHTANFFHANPIYNSRSSKPHPTAIRVELLPPYRFYGFQHLLRTMEDLNSHGPNNAMIHRWTFRDFITPKPESTVHVTGYEAILDALNLALTGGACVHHHAHSDSVYAPVLTAINRVCKTLSIFGFLPVTLNDLIEIQRQPWFQTLLEQYAKRYHLSDVMPSAGDSELTGDRIVVLLEALSLTQRIPKMELGVVVLCPGSLPHACHYPPTATQSSTTAWILVDARSEASQFYGIGYPTGRQQQEQGPLNEVDAVDCEESSSDDTDDEAIQDEDDDDEQPLNVPTTEPRKTAARVIAQQIPLPANLSAASILLQHKDRLQYVNILKVALVYSNQKISEECQAQGKLKQPSAIVKRINTALTWIEHEFDISRDAFRTALDRERKSNGIPIRGKDTAVDNTVLAANADKIDAAMTWVKTGGPRPTHITTATNLTGTNPLINHATSSSAPDVDGYDLDSILKTIKDPYSN